MADDTRRIIRCSCGIHMNDYVCPVHGKWGWEDETGQVHHFVRPRGPINEMERSPEPRAV